MRMRYIQREDGKHLWVSYLDIYFPDRDELKITEQWRGLYQDNSLPNIETLPYSAKADAEGRLEVPPDGKPERLVLLTLHHCIREMLEETTHEKGFLTIDDHDGPDDIYVEFRALKDEEMRKSSQTRKKRSR